MAQKKTKAHDEAQVDSTAPDAEQEKDMNERTHEEMNDMDKEDQAGQPEESVEAELRKQLEEVQAKADEYLDQWRRTAAEFANYKKRMEREKAEFQEFATANFIKKLLPAIDDLDRAFENLPEHLENDEWVDGIRMVRQKLMAVLEREGVEPIEDSGGAFDPNQHEALTHEESDAHQEGEVIDVIQKGYRIGDRILRHAQVRVAK